MKLLKYFSIGQMYKGIRLDLYTILIIMEVHNHVGIYSYS